MCSIFCGRFIFETIEEVSKIKKGFEIFLKLTSENDTICKIMWGGEVG